MNADTAPPPKRRQLSSVVARADAEGSLQGAVDQDPLAGGQEATATEEMRGEAQAPQQRDIPRRNFLVSYRGLVFKEYVVLV